MVLSCGVASTMKYQHKIIELVDEFSKKKNRSEQEGKTKEEGSQTDRISELKYISVDSKTEHKADNCVVVLNAQRKLPVTEPLIISPRRSPRFHAVKCPEYLSAIEQLYGREPDFAAIRCIDCEGDFGTARNSGGAWRLTHGSAGHHKFGVAFSLLYYFTLTRLARLLNRDLYTSLASVL